MVVSTVQFPWSSISLIIRLKKYWIFLQSDDQRNFFFFSLYCAKELYKKIQGHDVIFSIKFILRCKITHRYKARVVINKFVIFASILLDSVKQESGKKRKNGNNKKEKRKIRDRSFPNFPSYTRNKENMDYFNLSAPINLISFSLFAWKDWFLQATQAQIPLS